MYIRSSPKSVYKIGSQRCVNERQRIDNARPFYLHVNLHRDVRFSGPEEVSNAISTAQERFRPAVERWGKP
jgi:hypothetical protein